MEKSVITEYTNIANTIKETNSKLSVLRKRLKDLSTKIDHQMTRENLQVINLSQGGSITKKRTGRKKPINKDLVTAKVRQRFDHSQAERFLEDLYENREIDNVEKIYYKRT